MCKIGDEKIWSQGMLERFNVVLAHLRRVQDGTRWIQCVRSMGDPEIQKLKEMVAMIPEDDFQKRPNKPKAPPGEDVDGQELPEDLDHDGQTDSSSHPQTLVTQVLKYHWFLPPRTRSRRNGTL